HLLAHSRVALALLLELAVTIGRVLAQLLLVAIELPMVGAEVAQIRAGAGAASRRRIGATEPRTPHLDDRFHQPCELHLEGEHPLLFPLELETANLQNPLEIEAKRLH